MQNFSSADIYQRAVERLQANPDWNAVVNDSVISAVLRTNAEMNAETARYMEYLLRESKWDKAQNDSSILSMASMLGYRPRRKRAASGTVKFNGPVAAYTVIRDINDVPYVNFEASNEENEVVVYQGTLKEIEIEDQDIRATCTESLLDPHLTIPCVIKNCEDASSISTKKFFRIFEDAGGNSAPIEWFPVATTLFNDENDHYVEVFNDLYSRDLFYFKFNNDPERGAIFNKNHNLIIQYLETDGAAGNLSKIGRKFYAGSSVVGSNTSVISGGLDEESVEEMRISAPRYYLSSYTAGTKQAYEEAIKGIPLTQLGQTGKNMYPTEVLVWGSTETNSNGTVKPITNVSLIVPGLEDHLAESSLETTRASVEGTLNDYLWNLKAPQDELRFVLPTFAPFGLNITCRVPGTSTVDTSTLKASIQELVSGMWGSDGNLKFEKDFYPSEVISAICAMSKDVRSVTLETEAVEKLSWSGAQAIKVNENATGSVMLHCMKVPFDFNSIHKGTLERKGLEDDRSLTTGYAFRVDAFYKAPDTTRAEDKDVSIFIERSSSSASTIDVGVYNASSRATETGESGYASFATSSTRVKQFYRKKALTDAEYGNLAANTAISNREVSPGCLDTFYFHSSDDLSSEDGRILTGSYIKFGFDSLYDTLLRFKPYMSTEDRDLLTAAPLPILKCLEGEPTAQATAFTNFKALLEKYVDVYVSARPIDQTGLYATSDGVESTILYVDSYDATEQGVTDISDRKLDRFITVNIETI